MVRRNKTNLRERNTISNESGKQTIDGKIKENFVFKLLIMYTCN